MRLLYEIKLQKNQIYFIKIISGLNDTKIFFLQYKHEVIWKFNQEYQCHYTHF